MTRNDELIKKDVEDQLHWDSRIDSSDINVEVSEGAVTLSGKLPSLSACISALEAARDVSGVRRVKNDLKTKIPELVKGPNDEEIKMIVESMLRWNPEIISTDIDVSVEIGEVTLEGTVLKFWEKTKAGKIVMEAAGTTMITNKFSVVPTRKKADREITADIVAALDRNANIDIEWVDVKVVEGTATLSGNVPDHRAYQVADHVAASTSGVSAIINDIEIGYKPEGKKMSVGHQEKKSTEVNTYVLTIQLPENTMSRVEAFCSNNDISIEQFAVDALLEKLSHWKE
jgi:osmotically-inducible protein OsmY